MDTKKKNVLKTVLTIAISVAFAGFFLWIALKGLDFQTIQKSLARANYMWVLVSAVFGIAAYWFRAIRWNILLEPLGHKISHSNSLWSLSFGYLMNLTIPRSGELARATALYGVEKVPVDQSFGTIILERVVDLVCMLVFLAITLVFKYDAIFAFYQKSGIQMNPNKIFLVLGVLTVLGIVFFAVRNRLLHVPVIGKIVGFINGILSGLTTIFRLKQKLKFFIYTVGIWVSYLMASYLVCFALPETSDFSIADGCFILVVGTFGMMIPASGGIGAFNLALKFGIMALFLSMGKDPDLGAETGLIYSFISLPLQICIMLVMGLIAIPMLAKAKKI